MGQPPDPDPSRSTSAGMPDPATAVPVLMYHSVSDDPPAATRPLAVRPAQLEQQLALIAERGYSTVTMARLVSGEALPPRSVVLTFDDGYADFHRLALPLLTRYGATATLFVTTGWIDDATDRAATPAPDRMIAFSAIAEAAAAGVEIGAHSHTHAQLDQLALPALADELRRSKAILEDHLGSDVPGLAYPYGYWSRPVLSAAGAAGYTYGAAVGNALAAPDSDSYTLRRLTVSSATGLDTFQDVVAGRDIGRIYRRERVLTAGFQVVRLARRLARRLSRAPRRPRESVPMSETVTEAIPTLLVRAEPEPTTEAPARRRSLATSVLVSALGVAMVCAAFALARLHHPAAEAAFWAGQALTIAPIALWVLRRHPVSGRSAATAVTLYAAWQCVLRWAYSPDAFRFSDELQHMRGTQNLIDTGHLFQFNLSLPVSTGYPGLEIIATQLTRLFGVDAFVAGSALAMAAHLLLPGCLVLLYREVTGSPRIAALAALLYLLNPNARFFDISFVYETLALPFLVLAILFAVRWGRGTHRIRYAIGWLVCACLLVVTHHLSTAATALLMLLLAALCMFSADTRRIGAALAMFGVLTATLLGCWIAVAAPSTMDYVRTYGDQLVSGVGSLFGGSRGAAQSILASAPLSDRAMTAVGVLLTTVLLVTAAWRMRRSSDHLQRVFVIAGLSYGAIVGLRLALSEGAELSARALTFVSIITAVGLAVAILHLVDGAGRPTRIRTGGAVLAVLALLASGIATGVPSYWERLPGTFNIAGGPGSGIDTQNLDAAKWAARNIAPGSRFFGNVTAVTVYSTYAALDPLRDPENLFYSSGFTPADAETVRSRDADYIVVDLRMARDLPVTGRYFTSDVLAGKHTTPIPLEALTKFETIPGIAKVYDSGDVRIYGLRGSAYYAS